MEKREFLEIIQACRRRLNMAGFLKKLVFALCIGAGAGILFQAAAFVAPFYYADFYVALALILAAFAALAAAYVRRSTMEQAALTIDGFGFKERIITAYEHLEEEGPLVELQREDAMRRLRENEGRIRIRLCPSRKELALFAGLSAILLGLMLAPSAMKERARELHKVREMAKDKRQEIEEVVDSLEKLSQQELTPEQQAALQEMIESLQTSMAEYQQADSLKTLTAASDKLDYKYGNMSSNLANLAQILESGATASLAGAESMQAMADKLQEMSGQQLAQNGASNPQGGQGNQGGESGLNGNSGQENGEGQSSGSGGEGQGGGSSGSSEEGRGSASGGDGSGGFGNGRGTGSSNTPHDYVSVPNAIADSENLVGNAVNHDNSDYFRAQNGLTWEGTHISHEAVIGSYERNAYEGIAAGRYPSGMEDVIKEYFASFN